LSSLNTGWNKNLEYAHLNKKSSPIKKHTHTYASDSDVKDDAHRFVMNKSYVSFQININAKINLYYI